MFMIYIHQYYTFKDEYNIKNYKWRNSKKWTKSFPWPWHKNFYNLVQYFPQGDLMIDLVLQVLRQFCLIYSFTHPNPKYCPLQ